MLLMVGTLVNVLEKYCCFGFHMGRCIFLALDMNNLVVPSCMNCLVILK